MRLSCQSCMNSFVTVPDRTNYVQREILSLIILLVGITMYHVKQVHLVHKAVYLQTIDLMTF